MKSEDPNISGPLREKYQVLLYKLPANAYEKLDAAELRTEEGRVKAMTNLILCTPGRLWSRTLSSQRGTCARKRQALPALTGRTSSGTAASTESPSATLPVTLTGTSTAGH